jgi:hypothetical protein
VIGSPGSRHIRCDGPHGQTRVIRSSAQRAPSHTSMSSTLRSRPSTTTHNPAITNMAPSNTSSSSSTRSQENEPLLSTRSLTRSSRIDQVATGLIIVRPLLIHITWPSTSARARMSLSIAGLASVDRTLRVSNRAGAVQSDGAEETSSSRTRSRPPAS